MQRHERRDGATRVKRAVTTTVPVRTGCTPSSPSSSSSSSSLSTSSPTPSSSSSSSTSSMTCRIALALLCCAMGNTFKNGANAFVPPHGASWIPAAYSRHAAKRARSNNASMQYAMRSDRRDSSCGWGSSGGVRRSLVEIRTYAGRSRVRCLRHGRLTYRPLLGSCKVTALKSSEDDDGGPENFESIFDKNAAVLDVPLELYDEKDVEPPRAGATVMEMPIFMLDLAVCPGGVVPLHIFEMRYRQMMNDIGAKDNRFGMLVSDPETGKPCKYGAVLECAQRKLLPDGRQYLLNQAVERFRVLRVVKPKPYMVMQIEVGIPDDKPVEGEARQWGVEEGTTLEQLEMQVFDTVHSVVSLMNKLAPPSDVNEKRTLSEWFQTYAPKRRTDEGAEALPNSDAENERRMKFSYAVAEMIAMAPHTKQLLLQSRSTAYRLKAELEILMKAQKELAARSSLKDTLG